MWIHLSLNSMDTVGMRLKLVTILQIDGTDTVKKTT